VAHFWPRGFQGPLFRLAEHVRLPRYKGCIPWRAWWERRPHQCQQIQLKVQRGRYYRVRGHIEVVSSWSFPRFDIPGSDISMFHRRTVKLCNSSNPRDANGSRVYQVIMQQMQPLPCTQSTFVDTLKGNRKVVDVNEAIGRWPTKKRRVWDYKKRVLVKRHILLRKNYRLLHRIFFILHVHLINFAFIHFPAVTWIYQGLVSYLRLLWGDWGQ